MRKKIWIFNHYATKMFEDRGGRHYWFAENLLKQGYEPTIFCASTIHNSARFIDTHDSIYLRKELDDIPFVFVNVPKYSSKYISRVSNMIVFYRKLFPTVKQCAREQGEPDIIMASSVHPLTLIAGIKIARKFGVPCICEIRDLWPETIVQFGRLKRNSLAAKALYSVEKNTYKKADRIIFTIEGGIEYLKNQAWDCESGGSIDLCKVSHINNGIDLDRFNLNRIENSYSDIDLEDAGFKVIYTGSMGQANSLFNLLLCAKILKEKNYDDIKFLLYGDGNQANELQQYVKDNELKNVVFKGLVEKKYIPYILSKANLNIFTGINVPLYKYGLSLNKLFDYFGSGRPTLSNINNDYDLLDRYECGVTVAGDDPEALAEGVLKFYYMAEKHYDSYCQNALTAAKDFDFKVLTNKLINVIEEL